MPKHKESGIYIIPLRRVYMAGSTRDRGTRAVRIIRRFLERHLGGRVILDPAISVYIYRHKMTKPPRYVPVKFVKLDEGVYKAFLALEVPK